MDGMSDMASEWLLPPYVRGLTACQVFQVLLQEWYSEDEKVLVDISNGDLTLKTVDDDLIHPQVWEQVIEHNANILFEPHSSYAAPQDTDDTAYASRVQYVVKYFGKSAASGANFFVRQQTDNKPIKFEITNGAEELPALEEIKEMTVHRYRDTEHFEAESAKKALVIGPHDYCTSTTLKIHSTYVLNVLRSVVEYAVGAQDEEQFGLGVGVYQHPYQELYHHISDLLDYRTGISSLRHKHSDSYNQKCDEHIDLLLEYLSSPPNISISECKARWESEIPVVTFATYWLLLKPGTDVYVREADGSLNAYIVDSVKGGVSETDGKKINSKYRVKVWNLAFGGKTISPCTRMVEVDIFDKEREITSLRIFPTRFLDETDGAKQRKALVDRGKRYFEYSKQPSFLQYSGNGLKKGTKTVSMLRVLYFGRLTHSSTNGHVWLSNMQHYLGVWKAYVWIIMFPRITHWSFVSPCVCLAASAPIVKPRLARRRYTPRRCSANTMTSYPARSTNCQNISTCSWPHTCTLLC